MQIQKRSVPGRAEWADVEKPQIFFGGNHIMFVSLRNTILIVATMLIAQAFAVAADTPFLRSAKEVK